jgi:hypothetical protein
MPRTASYAMPSQAGSPWDGDAEVLWKAMMPDRCPGVPVRTEVALGLAARVLLERCDGADMLVLGTTSDGRTANRSAGPVIRACLRRSPCPVVVINEDQDPLRRDARDELPGELSGDLPGLHVPAPAPPGGSVSPGSRDLGVLPIPV